jgi:hypothetical protein
MDQHDAQEGVPVSSMMLQMEALRLAEEQAVQGFKASWM